MTLLGHVVTKKGIKVNPQKINAVTEWPGPSNVTEVRSFLGLTGVKPKIIHCFNNCFDYII